MNWLHNLFAKIFGFVHSPKVQAVAVEIENLLPVALSVVAEIDKAVPNRTLEEFAVIATKYGYPVVDSIATGTNFGNLLLNLGTWIMAKLHAPTAATSLLNTVVQLAVVTSHAAATPVAEVV